MIGMVVLRHNQKSFTAQFRQSSHLISAAADEQAKL
jgi:hypothetical protein